MRRYLWGSIGFAVGALSLMSGFAVYQLSRGLADAEVASRERMQSLAEYIVEYVRRDIFSYSFVLNPQSVPADFLKEKSEWLGRLAGATGLQRVALTDSNGVIYISSVLALKPGKNIRPWLLDSASFNRALKERSAVYAQAAGSASKQSLYYPFDFFGTGHVVVLESDRNLLSQFESFRRFTYGLATALALVLVALVSAILMLDRRAQAALAASHRHEQLAFLGRTSAELAHELRNPLAVIKASVDVLRRRFDPEGRDRAFNFLSDETMGLARIIANILGLSRNQMLETQPSGLTEILAAATANLKATYPEVTVSWEAPPAAMILADGDVARQVLGNILINAGQAMDGKGSLFMRAALAGDNNMRLLIADTGPGVPKALRKTLFHPFVTATRTGAGLGLALVKSWCERMQWKIALLPDREARRAFPGRQVGACFALDLPVPASQK